MVDVNVLLQRQHPDGSTTPWQVNADGTDPVPTSSFTNRSGAIAVLNISQVVMAANASRRYLFFQNVSDTDMWIRFGAAATEDQPSILCGAGGGGLVLESFVNPDQLQVICTMAGKSFTAYEA